MRIDILSICMVNQKTIPREVRVAWLAGIFDGEGTFGIYRKWSGRNRYSQLFYHFNIANTDKKIISEIHAIFSENGIISRIKNHVYDSRPQAKTYKGNKPCWRVHLHGKSNMAKALSLLIPYLVGRKKQAEIMRDFFVRYPNLWKSYPDLPRSGAKEDILRSVFYDKLIQTFKDARND